MATYLIIEVTRVKDEAQYQRYVQAARAIVKKHHGEYLIRSRDIQLVTGTTKPERLILVKFPDAQTAKTCFDAAEYRTLTPMRERAVESGAFLVNQ
ncbi:MAG: DUF1330 domain-containing protein [Candidatus Marinimicrobia bacterium]|jgi:uncharacterized protein (DUF1330 family)|nr:DUF1330 domain-containing protein [Candidatus Neomarinimicrobiota bacterium]MCK9483747.1 DUF1330 domain-containing protein [Candidatus Neomarinimicrobiota bacterium]MCK9560705.1 DUF1330 domain-containing protein [Candidatus Neomarinimicrobiota bacterium]